MSDYNFICRFSFLAIKKHIFAGFSFYAQKLRYFELYFFSLSFLFATKYYFFTKKDFQALVVIPGLLAL
jgi:hypothetical protein